MNLQEAYSILNIPDTSTPEEAKKKYRELSKKLHPDVNKEPNAEDNFKKINEAYQVVSTGKSTDREDAYGHAGSHHPFVQQRVFHAEHILTHITISFAESVLGCKKEIKFNRKTKCQSCNSLGEIAINNGCTKCGGRGKIVSQQNGIIFVHMCGKCGGKMQKTICSTCRGDGILNVEALVNVSIPGGIVDGNILNLQGMGNYVGTVAFGFMDQYTDTRLHVIVIPEPGLSIEGNNVICTLEISLQEALVGCKKTVKTIHGYRDVDVKPRSRNKEELFIPHLGVNQIGNQRIILDVKYPEDVSKIINILQETLPVEIN